jgi:hypothetical protein
MEWVMKISESQGTMIEGQLKKADKKQTEDAGFHRVMDQVMSREGEKGGQSVPQAPSIPPADGIQIMSGVPRKEGVSQDGFKNQAIAQIQETLDLVDFYAEKLGDTKLPVSGMSGLVEHLEGKLEGLKSLESQSDVPAGLKSILNDVTTTLGAEIAKFKRGDYA